MLPWIRSNPRLIIAAVVLGALWIAAAAVGAGLNPQIAGLLYLTVLVVAAVVARRLSRGAGGEHLSARTAVMAFVIGVLVVGVAIQAVPYGWARSNPPVTGEPAWDSPRTEQLARAACFDCHSNEVAYPWYSYVAPFSWAVQRHVAAGRDKVNYSEWDHPQRDADESAETVEDGSMPPLYYLIAHPEARLSDAEKRELIAGLEATIGGRERADDRDDDD